jgi:Zn-dependent protease
MFRKSFRLVKIAGIEIQLDYSWFIIFFLITWSLGAYQFPATHPGWSAGLYWLLALITSILFFCSVVVHELAHSLVSNRTGVPVRRITLFIFGGAAQLSDEPKSALDEFLMALAGPVTSLVIGGAFALVWFFVRAFSEPLAALAGWLGAINIMLAVFNLIPGFPLDGGRVFRAIVWGITRNLKTATKVATFVGQAVAFLFIFAGVWMIFRGLWINGLWIAFIGWFLETAASSSYRQVALREMLQGHTAREVMTTDCPKVPRNITLEQLVHDYILSTHRRCFPVTDGNNRVDGIVTLHNVKGVPREDWGITTVEQIMIPFDKMKTVRPDAGLFQVLEQMASEDINQLPVVDSGVLVGMVGRDSVLSFIHARTELGV